MMMLGVVRHASMSYAAVPIKGWPYTDPLADMSVYWLIVFIRVFHLPVFFVVAGFFAAYLIESRGTRAFLRHRWSRLAVPFLVAWPVVGTAMYFVLQFASPFSSVPTAYDYNLDEARSAEVLEHLFIHLWFLYHLIILSVVASALRPLARRIPEAARRRALDLFERLVHRGGIVVPIAVLGLVMHRMQSWALDYYAGPFPPPRLLAAYGLFFGFGWLLFRRRAALEGFKRPAWIHLAAGVACILAYRHFLAAGCEVVPTRSCAGGSEAHHLGAIAFLAPAMWFMTYGLIGLFQRYADGPSARWRYMADASYWIYIVHVPFVILLALPLANVALPAMVKVALVFGAATGLTLVGYRYLVRPTFIGKQLNGRRYPRGAAS